jgi:hypothetical protein
VSGAITTRCFNCSAPTRTGWSSAGVGVGLILLWARWARRCWWGGLGDLGAFWPAVNLHSRPSDSEKPVLPTSRGGRDRSSVDVVISASFTADDLPCSSVHAPATGTRANEQPRQRKDVADGRRPIGHWTVESAVSCRSRRLGLQGSVESDITAVTHGLWTTAITKGSPTVSWPVMAASRLGAVKGTHAGWRNTRAESASWNSRGNIMRPPSCSSSTSSARSSLKRCRPVSHTTKLSSSVFDREVSAVNTENFEIGLIEAAYPRVGILMTGEYDVSPERCGARSCSLGRD